MELGSGISAAFAARLIADWGADVIKVEAPEGDESRRAGPFPGVAADPERSGLFLYLNFNKRGIALDLSARTGLRRLEALLAGADAVIENLGPGEFDRLVSDAPLPEPLVVCSISPYGQTGPRARYTASEISAYASGGLMYMTGTDDRPPVKHGFNQAQHLAGVNAAAATLAAVRQARRSGNGPRIDISAQETVAMTIFPALSVYSHTGADIKRAPPTLPKLATSQAMEAADGWIMPSDAGIDVWWQTFAEFVGCPELMEPPFADRESRHRHENAIDDIVGPAFGARTRADLFHGGQERGLTMSSVQTPQEIAGCPHLGERGFFIDQHHPVAGTVLTPGMVPLTRGRLDRTPRLPAPLFGQHNEDVLGALDCVESSSGASATPRPVRTGEPKPLLPLEGVRILELGMVFVLPLAITPLAALGADVIKVESASRPDSVRSGPMPGNRPRPGAHDHSGNFHLINRNKRAITLDLSTRRGRELLLDLVRVSDVVAENFTPRVLSNLGLGYDELRKANPRI
ncbi:MAG: CoA transferase, partial [Dehalococcoidia bacterium]